MQASRKYKYIWNVLKTSDVLLLTIYFSMESKYLSFLSEIVSSAFIFPHRFFNVIDNFSNFKN